MKALRYPRLFVFPQLRDAVLGCICDEPVTLRHEPTTDARSTNLASSVTSSRRAFPLTVASVALLDVQLEVQGKGEICRVSRPLSVADWELMQMGVFFFYYQHLYPATAT